MDSRFASTFCVRGPARRSSAALAEWVMLFEMPARSTCLIFSTISSMPEKICRIWDGLDGMIGILGGEIDPGRQVGLFGIAPIELDENDARDPRGSERRHVVFFHLVPEPDLHDHLDEPVVGGHPDGLHAAHVHAAVLDGRVLLEALDGFVEVGDETVPFFEVLRGPDPDDGYYPQDDADGDEESEGTA